MQNNTIVGYLFNHPRREEDKYKDGTCCCVGLDQEYDVSCLKESSLALTLKNCRGKQSVYPLGTQKKQKPQREDYRKAEMNGERTFCVGELSRNNVLVVRIPRTPIIRLLQTYWS